MSADLGVVTGDAGGGMWAEEAGKYIRGPASVPRNISQHDMTDYPGLFSDTL